MNKTNAPISDSGSTLVEEISSLLSEKQLAQEWGISPRTLQMWRFKGGGPPYIKLGAAVRYRRADAEQWLALQQRSSTSDPGPDS